MLFFPYGENIHWTSAFDLILYAGAYLGTLLLILKFRCFGGPFLIDQGFAYIVISCPFLVVA